MNIELESLRGERLLVALSGGADSMCLLHYLHANGIDVSAAHYEHGIRGEESERDLRFVQSWCESSKIPFVFDRGDVPAYAKANAMSIEEAARKLRYEFLERQREKLGCSLIVTAHNAEDNAETLLMNLIRGSGAKGLSGIPRRRGNIIRPLLDVSRAEIEAYLKQNAIPHVEDSTNNSDDYTRNLIRHKIMPLARQINPGFVSAAARTAELMGRDEDCLSLAAEDYISKHGGDFLPLDSFNALHAAVASRVLRAKLTGLGAEHVEDVLSFCQGTGYGELSLPGRKIVRDAGRLYLNAPECPELKERPLIPGQSLYLDECGISVKSEICIYKGEVNDLFKTSYIKYEIINSNLRIGGRKEGDRLRPMARGCTKSLKALFVEKKIPRHLRGAMPVLRDDEGILLVWGLAADERIKVQKGEKALKITFEK